MKCHRLVIKQLSLLIRDDTGGEVIEYALILGLIIVVTITLIGQFGTKVVARWSSANSSM